MNALRLKVLFACALVAIIFFLTGCTDNAKAEKVLRSQGYRDIHLTGYRYWGCSKDDSFHTGFRAVSASGAEATGVVCSDWFKGATVRFD